MINAGKYRHKIAILRNTRGRDAYGEPLDEWQTFKNVWASANPIIGREFFSGLTADVKVDVKFNTRYIEGVKNDMRVCFDGGVYEIVSAVDVNSLHRELLIYCRELKSDVC